MASLYAEFITYEEGFILKNKKLKKIGISIATTLVAMTGVAVAMHFHYTRSTKTVGDGSTYIEEIEIQGIDIDDTEDVQIQGDNITQVISTQVINNYYNDPDKADLKDDKSSGEDSEVGFETGTHVRLADDKDRTWYKIVSAKVGDKVEFRILYTNTSDKKQNNVAIRDILPSNLKYIKGSSIIKNTSFPDGSHILNDALVDNGIRIGNYTANGGNALVYFTAEVVNEDLVEGTNTLSNWGQAGVGEITIQDHADVIVNIPKE